jgi:hypothetical protein
MEPASFFHGRSISCRLFLHTCALCAWVCVCNCICLLLDFGFFEGRELHLLISVSLEPSLVCWRHFINVESWV